MIHADVSSPEWQIFVMQENIDSRRRACAFIMGVPYEVRILATRNSRAWVLERSSTCNMLKGSGTCSLEHSRSRKRYTMLWNMLGNRVDLGTGGRLSTIYMAPASMWVMPHSCSVPRCRRRLPPIYSILAIKWGFLKQFQRVAAR